MVDASAVDITSGAFKLRSKPNRQSYRRQVQQGAQPAALVKQAAKATGVETVNAIKDNLKIEEAALAAKLAALDEDSTMILDDEKDEEEEKETKEGEAAAAPAEDVAGEGEKKEGDGDAGTPAAAAAAVPEDPAVWVMEKVLDETIITIYI